MDSQHLHEPVTVPVPRSCLSRPGDFQLTARTRIIADAASASSARLLADVLRRSTGFPLPVTEGGGPAGNAAIVLAADGSDADLGPEGYRLSVAPEGARVIAVNAAGTFNGTQTLLQLLPADVFAPRAVQRSVWEMPCLEMEDAPRFSWRGFMLDCARHFFPRVEIERVLDLLAMHKLNVFHWHLTDDQGWRVEVPKRPLLTERSAWRGAVGFGLDPASTTAYDAAGRYGGFYTREDIRAIVAAAAERNITIVPEIEMPGHATAALSAYPSLGCTAGPYAVEGRPGIFTDIFCAGNEETFAFLADVLDEVVALFPGRFIHIGGDEAPKERWHACPHCQARMKSEGLRDEHELQGWFIRRIAGMVEERGRRLIGWSECREGGLARGAVLMDWIGGGVESARDGHDVIMTPTASCYIDYAQLRTPDMLPVFPKSYLPVSRVRAFEPVPAELEQRFHARVLGTQANLWTEYVPSLERLEYQAFPRLCALAEVAWSRAGEGRADFDARLRTHLARLQQAKVHFCPQIE